MCGARAAPVDAMKHVLLLGDSSLDNGAYVGGGPDVLRQVLDLLGDSGRAALHARDGSVIADVRSQLEWRPSGTTHIVVSIGGNDALLHSGVLEEGARSVADALARLAAIRDDFQQSYAQMLDRVMAVGLPTAVCTIYEPRFPEPQRRRVAAVALTILNDVITREAFARGATLIDLRLVCGRDEDFANPIEPSSTGGAKIARAIAKFVDATKPSAAVIACG
jgi:hypothetical protein